MSKWKDDKFTHLDSDIEKLRVRTTMYISYTGSRGALHLCKELINNAIDEAANPQSPCDTMEVEYDVNTNRLTVRDNGRGIPFEQVETVCSYLQAGSNLFKSTDKKNAGEYAGENGVGLTAVNALSKEFSLIIYRDGKRGLFTFDDGKLVDTKYTKCSEKNHGTTVTFVPDEKYLGKCKIDHKELRKWIYEISYLLPKKKTISYSFFKKGADVPVTEVFKHKKGLDELMDEMLVDKVCGNIHLSQVYPEINTRTEVIFNMSSSDTTDFTNVKSYCNRVSTIEGGKHVDAMKTAWCKAISKIASELLTDKEKEKLNISFDDCRVGLTAIVVCYTPDPKFTGQTKQKVDNEDLFKPIVAQVTKDLIKYLHDNPNDAKKIITLIKKTAKARQEISKVRKSDYKPMDNLEAVISKIYSPCSSSKYSELWIFEGSSAKDGFDAFRDTRFQASFRLRGNPKNVYGCTVPNILSNPELKALTRVIGAGIGKDFSLSKVKFDKIIILVDSDIDGWNMTSLLSAFFLWCMPELVKAGKLYRAVAPLYVLNDDKKPYLLSKKAYYEFFAQKVIKNCKLKTLDGKVLPEKKVMDLIVDNKDYLEELESITRFYYTNHNIIEFILLYGKDKDFAKKLKKVFPHLEYNPEDNSICGEYNGAYQYIFTDKQFYERSIRLYDLIHKTNNSQIYYEISYGKNQEFEKMTLGEFFQRNKIYLPQVEERIKGIGELDGNILWDTTLNPQTRQLIRLTMSDLDTELDVVKILHGNNPDDRKKFMEGYRVEKDMLDT